MRKLATVMTALVMLGMTAVANNTGNELNRSTVNQQISNQIDLSELKNATSAKEVIASVLFTIDSNGSLQVVDIVSTDSMAIDYIRKQISGLQIVDFGMEAGKSYLVKLHYRIL